MDALGAATPIGKEKSSFDRLAYRPTEAAAAVGVSRTELYRWLRAGLLPAYKRGRSVLILRKDLEDFVENSTKYIDA